MIVSMLRSFKCIRLKFMISLRMNSSISASGCVVSFRIFDSLLLMRRSPSLRFCAVTRVSLSKREIWMLPPLTSMMAVPFPMNFWNSSPREAIDL